MSQQLQITGGAKVRSLEGVITGTAGVLSSLPINGSSGIPQLDSNGKILVSQLPNSVMEYKGTWNATTNTPTLVNGTGNQGDVYLCNVAGTANFGAGPITFAVGDQVIYSGTIWQKAGGSTGTVTSVAVTESGDALLVTGSPITTSGTINIGFAGTSAQYVAGDGTLITFPTIGQASTLISEVYNSTGATLTKGTVVYINGGHGNLPTVTKAIANSDATSAQTYGVVRVDITNNNNGYVIIIGSLTDLDTQAYANGTQLYLSSTTAGAWTSTKQYAPNHLVYVGIVTRSHPTQGVVEVKIQNGYELDELHDVSAQSPSNNNGIFYNSTTSLWENKSIATALGYTPADVLLVVPYTGATASVSLGAYGLTSDFLQSNYLKLNYGYASSPNYSAIMGVYKSTFNEFYLNFGTGTTSITQYLKFPLTTGYTYTFPEASGTLILSTAITGTTNYISKFTSSSTIGDSLLFDNGTNVGIGTASPSFKLDVTGTGRFTGQLTLGSTITNGTYTYTLPSATGTLALASVGVSGRIPYFDSTTTQTTSANLVWDNTNNFISTSGVYVYNNTTNAYMLTSNGDNIGTIFNASTTTWGLGYSLSPSSFSTSVLTWNNSGNVGIGTSNQRTLLDIRGNSNTKGVAIGGGAIPSDLSHSIDTNARYLMISGADGGSNPNYGALWLVNNASTEASNILLGTFLFGQKLSSAKSGTNAGTKASIGSFTTGSGGSVGGFGGILAFYTKPDNAPNDVGSYERLRIDMNGNVGIGTSSPSNTYQGLTIYGSNPSLSLHTSNASGWVWTEYKNSAGTNNFSMGVNQSIPQFVIKAGAGLDSPNFIMSSTGNVGINQSTPTSKLDVNGTGRFTSSLIANSFSTPVTISPGSTTWNIYHDQFAAGDFGFWAASTNRFLINASGFVGIGSTNPLSQLEVKGGTPFIRITDTTTNSETGLIMDANGAVRGGLTINYGTGEFKHYCGVAGNGYFQTFHTNGSERMRITSGGQVAIANSGGGLDTARLYVLGSGATAGEFGVTGTSGTLIRFSNGQSVGGSITIAAGGGTSYNTSSDYRLKEDLREINGLEKISAIKVYDFKWKICDERMYGVLAHELQEVLPFAVNGEKDGKQMQGVDYSLLVPVLVKAIQEQQQQIDELKSLINK